MGMMVKSPALLQGRRFFLRICGKGALFYIAFGFFTVGEQSKQWYVLVARFILCQLLNAVLRGVSGFLLPVVEIVLNFLFRGLLKCLIWKSCWNELNR